MPRARTGTIIKAANGRWRGAITVGEGVRRYVHAGTESEVRAKLLALSPAADPQLNQGTVMTRADRTHVVLETLRRARPLGWTDERIAEVLGATLTARRIARRVVGPCHYCGNELASTIDHVIPTARGGPDTADNIVSCCQSCNMRKGDSTPEEWRESGR